MYQIKFSQHTNLTVFNAFVQAIDKIRLTTGHDANKIILVLREQYHANLVGHATDPIISGTEYICEFPSEKEYTWFLLRWA